MSIRPLALADEAVRPARILHEVLGVAAGITAAMLRQENAIRAVRPARASLPDVIRTEALMQISAGHSAADVFHKPAHARSLTSALVAAQPSD